MLMKLIKHEFRATGRIMVPLYIILLVSAVLANISTRTLMEMDNWFFSLLGGLLMASFPFAIIGVCVMSMVLMVQRFYKNLLGDEGYVMFTLPVSVHQHIWTKLIVSAVWFAANVLMICISGVLMIYEVGFVTEFLREMADFIQRITGYYALNGAALAAELLLLAFVGSCSMCLQFYAAMAAGYSFPTHKGVWSVLFFFGTQFAMQLLGGIMLNVLDMLDVFDKILALHLEEMAAIHGGMMLLILGTVLHGAIFYIITAFFLKKRLNLE